MFTIWPKNVLVYVLDEYTSSPFLPSLKEGLRKHSQFCISAKSPTGYGSINPYSWFAFSRFIYLNIPLQSCLETRIRYLVLAEKV
jgi:hypothetical protein